jgi:hypothetical protein
MNIDEYAQLIKKNFYYLFEEYGFSNVYICEIHNRHKVFRVGIQSEICKILFVREQGAGVSFLGTSNAPFENEMNENWISLISLLGYILKKEFDWTFLNTLSRSQQIEASLSFSSSQFKPHTKQMIEMFSSQENVAKWKSAYKQYIKEKVRRS